MKHVLRDRYLFIDGLRGLAALSVAVFHFYRGAGLYGALSSITPAPLDLLLLHGYLGVQVFFVISGFVIAYSVHGEYISPGFVGRFALRRSLRLDPPFWCTLLLVVALNVGSRGLGGRPTALPSPAVILANASYLDGILNQPEMLAVSWTLCLEIQFYLVFIFGLLLCQRVRLHPLVPVGSLFVISYVVNIMGRTNVTWFPYYWYAFGVGVLACWVMLRLCRFHWWLDAVAALVLLAVLQRNVDVSVAVATSAVILVAAKRQRLTTWLRAGCFQWLGALSYCFYLLHTVIGSRVEYWGLRLTGSAPAPAVVWVALAMLATLCAAYILRRCTELPGIRLGKYLKDAPTQRVSWRGLTRVPMIEGGVVRLQR